MEREGSRNAAHPGASSSHSAAPDEAARAGENAPPPEDASGAAGEPEAPPPGLPAGSGPDVGTPEPPRAGEEDFRDKWLRAEAELQNYRRRVQREQEQLRRSAEDAVLRDVITVLDDLERAIAALSPEQAASSWTQGVTLVAQRLRDTLARHGIEPLDPLGQPFDPGMQEAILEVDAPPGTAPGAVVQVIHKGYRRGDRTLRAARVIVAREPHPEG